MGPFISLLIPLLLIPLLLIPSSSYSLFIIIILHLEKDNEVRLRICSQRVCRYLPYLVVGKEDGCGLGFSGFAFSGFAVRGFAFSGFFGADLAHLPLLFLPRLPLSL